MNWIQLVVAFVYISYSLLFDFDPNRGLDGGYILTIISFDFYPTEAWTEVTQSKQEVVLAPVKPPSRMGGDASSDERSPRDGSTDISPRESKNYYLIKSFLIISNDPS